MDMTWDPSEFFGDLIRQHIAVADNVIETACEQALQQGTCGVTVFHAPDGTVIAAVDESVPYGEIHHQPL